MGESRSLFIILNSALIRLTLQKIKSSVASNLSGAVVVAQ